MNSIHDVSWRMSTGVVSAFISIIFIDKLLAKEERRGVKDIKVVVEQRKNVGIPTKEEKGKESRTLQVRVIQYVQDILQGRRARRPFQAHYLTVPHSLLTSNSSYNHKVSHNNFLSHGSEVVNPETYGYAMNASRWIISSAKIAAHTGKR